MKSTKLSELRSTTTRSLMHLSKYSLNIFERELNEREIIFFSQSNSLGSIFDILTFKFWENYFSSYDICIFIHLDCVMDFSLNHSPMLLEILTCTSQSDLPEMKMVKSLFKIQTVRFQDSKKVRVKMSTSKDPLTLQLEIHSKWLHLEA